MRSPSTRQLIRSHLGVSEKVLQRGSRWRAGTALLTITSIHSRDVTFEIGSTRSKNVVTKVVSTEEALMMIANFVAAYKAKKEK